jgi:hypothetical protein
MKRYLCILIAAIMALTSCEPLFIIDKGPDVSYYFSTITVETTENSAVIDAIKPYITVDGVKEENNITIYLEYWIAGQESAISKVENYTETEEHIFFTLEGLTPNTAYRAQMTISGEYGTAICDPVPFRTKEHTPVVEYSCACEVDAKGLYATVNLSEIAYLVDGEAQDIHILKMEYALQNTEEWASHEFAGNAIENGALSHKIPFGIAEILAESSDYKLRVTLFPTNSDYEPITCDEYEFNTKSAEISAHITTPSVGIIVDKLNITIGNATVYYDGLNIPNYGEEAYEFAYRKSGSNLWEELSPVELKDKGYSGAYDVTLFEEGATYEIIGRVTVNGTLVFESDAASITMPKSETPTPPTPPVSGDADTAALAGDWHLTEWRGTEPSFDIYLSISEDGVVTLWQRLESRLWETFYSTVGFDGSTITGEYTDGVAWAASYYVAVDGDTMTWTNTADSTEVSVYTRCTLPDFTNPDIRTYAAEGRRFL